jgi:hypothetical protein
VIVHYVDISGIVDSHYLNHFYNKYRKLIISNHTTGLTKPGEVGDFFALVSMKSFNFCQKAKSFQVSIFFTIILFLQYSRKRSSHVPEIRPIQGLMFNILFQTR